MTVITESRITSVMRAAEALLSHRAGSPVVLAEPEDLGGSGRTTVVRVRVAQNPLSMDRTFVIKALPEHENPHAFHREIASYKYATALPTESRPGPQLIASDPDVRLMVLSDLGHGHPMTSLLAGTDVVEISRAVSAWGQALGRMHAATVGGEGDFLALARRGPVGDEGSNMLRDEARRAVAAAPERVADLAVPLSDGVSLPASVSAALESACTLFDDGDHRSFSPSDVGSENILFNEEGVQFMDYEWGGFRDATLDIAYALVTFSAQLGTQALTHRPELEVSMVEAWRSEVHAIWPSLRRDREMAQKIIGARLLWVWLSTTWMLPALESGEPIPPSFAHDLSLHTNDPRVIVARWSDLASSARAEEPAIADFATEVGIALQRAWLA